MTNKMQEQYNFTGYMTTLNQRPHTIIKFFFIIIFANTLCICTVNASSNLNNNNQVVYKKNNGNRKPNHIHEKSSENSYYNNNKQYPFMATRSANDAPYNNDACQLNIECNSNKLVPLRLPIYGPKGDQGPPGIMGMKGDKGEPGIAGIPARDPPPPNFSAFFAALANNTGPYKQDKDLVFTHVITNYGENYDSNTGIYTAPYNGVYQFLITISATGRQKAGVNIMRNKQAILTVWSESEPWSTSSQTILLKLSVNDQVYLKLQSRASHVHGYMYSSFGGNLLYEEINPS